MSITPRVHDLRVPEGEDIRNPRAGSEGVRCQRQFRDGGPHSVKLRALRECSRMDWLSRERLRRRWRFARLERIHSASGRSRRLTCGDVNMGDWRTSRQWHSLPMRCPLPYRRGSDCPLASARGSDQSTIANLKSTISNHPGSVMDIGSSALSSSLSERTFFSLATWRTVLPEAKASLAMAAALS